MRGGEAVSLCQDPRALGIFGSASVCFWKMWCLDYKQALQGLTQMHPEFCTKTHTKGTNHHDLWENVWTFWTIGQKQNIQKTYTASPWIVEAMAIHQRALDTVEIAAWWHLCTVLVSKIQWFGMHGMLLYEPRRETQSKLPVWCTILQLRFSIQKPSNVGCHKVSSLLRKTGIVLRRWLPLKRLTKFSLVLGSTCLRAGCKDACKGCSMNHWSGGTQQLRFFRFVAHINKLPDDVLRSAELALFCKRPDEVQMWLYRSWMYLMYVIVRIRGSGDWTPKLI